MDSVKRGGGAGPGTAAPWRRLPDETRLGVCAYLDARAIGLLEMCGRGCLGDAARAWRDKGADEYRGSLADWPTKRFVVAHDRRRALEPAGRRWEDVLRSLPFRIAGSWHHNYNRSQDFEVRLRS